MAAGTDVLVCTRPVAPTKSSPRSEGGWSSSHTGNAGRTPDPARDASRERRAQTRANGSPVWQREEDRTPGQRSHTAQHKHACAHQTKRERVSELDAQARRQLFVSLHTRTVLCECVLTCIMILSHAAPFSLTATCISVQRSASLRPAEPECEWMRMAAGTVATSADATAQPSCRWSAQVRPTLGGWIRTPGGCTMASRALDPESRAVTPAVKHSASHRQQQPARVQCACIAQSRSLSAPAVHSASRRRQPSAASVVKCSCRSSPCALLCSAE